MCLPHLGGKIVSIFYKPGGLELLWRNPRVAPHPAPPGACYDDHWSGGWDELFPNDEPAVIDGVILPDHGEVWTSSFDACPSHNGTALCLSAGLPASGVRYRKRIRLDDGAPRFHIDYRLENVRDRDLPCLFKLHPAFALSPACRIQIPAVRVVLEPACLGALAGAPLSFPWPHAPLPGGAIDLRELPARDSRELRFLYATGLTDGWCSIEHPEHGIAATLSFSPEIFRSCWLFGSFGGWRDTHVAVLEPCTGYPFRLEQAIAEGTAGVLPARGELHTEVSLSVGKLPASAA